MNRKNNKNKLDEEQIDLGFTGMDQVSDRQYNSMIPNKKGKLDALSYFKNSQKYAGQTKYKQQQEQDQQQFIQQPQNQEQQQPEEGDGIKQALLQIKQKRKQRSNLLSEDLKAIDKEDRENLLRMKQDQRQQGNPQALQNQLNQFNKLIQIRYYSQKNLQNLKKYPINNYPASSSLHYLHKQSQKVALTNLQKLVHNYQKLSVDFFKNQINITKYDDILTSTSNNLSKRLNVQKLWQRFQQQTKEINQKMQKQIINWSQRTVLLRNSTSKSQYNSLFMQTPIGQCKKAISDWDKVSKKCQQKRSPFRILFQPQQNLRQNYDKNIYDDLDLVQQVQKNYQQELQRDDKDFLVNDTLKYLQNKSKTKISKDVDRKASKNRKIRYNAHPKLLNFMPCQIQNFLDARDQIVKNLFNKGTDKEEAIDFIDI